MISPEKAAYTWQSGVYVKARKLEEKGLRFLSNCFAGISLGLLRDVDLASVDAWYYDHQSMYRDPEYNRSGLLHWERALLEKYFPARGRILLAAAGGGREVLALRRLGYEVDSFECNPQLAAHANHLLSEEGWAANVRVAPRNECPDCEVTYDGLIVGWGAYMLIPGGTRRVRFLRQMRSHVLPGAPVVLSFFPRAEADRSFRLVAGLANSLRACLRRPRLETGDNLSPSFVHHCTRGEIREALSMAGFELAYFNSVDYGYAVGIAGMGVLACPAEGQLTVTSSSAHGQR